MFEELRRRGELERGLPLKTVLADHWRAVIVSMLLTWVLTAAIVVVILMTPSLIAKPFHIAPADALAANSIATLCLSIGCVVFGLAADRIGAARAVLIGCAMLFVAVYALYLGLGTAPQNLDWLYAAAGFCVGVVGVIPTVLVRAFPARVRFSGVSFAYNVAYAIFGGLTPLVVSMLLPSQPLAPAHYVAVLCIVGVVVAVTLLRRESCTDSTASSARV